MLTPTDLKTSPPGDWKYLEESTGVRFSHHDLKTLMGQIRVHRQAVGLPTHGDWIEQVYAKMCEQNSNLRCHDDTNPDRVWLAEDVWRFLTTLKEVAVQGAGMVPEEEQLRRIEICKQCPKLGVIACRWCGPIAEMLTEFIGSRKLPKIAEVWKKACLGCGCDVTSKTAYSLEVLQAVDSQLGTNPSYFLGDASHPKCWMLEPQP